MPFGLTNAPATFQRLIQNVLRNELDKYAIAYLDDILIFSKSITEHNEHVETILKKLQDNQLYAKIEKCEFFKSEVEFLGHIISKNGIKTDPSKIKAITDWPTPKSITDVRSFHGICNFYRRFISKFSEVAAPITDTLKEETFSWSTAAQDAFEKLKSLLISAPILQACDPNKPKRLETDASNVAIGGVLHQKHDGKWHPVAFYSQKLNGAQINYPIHEKELLALIQALKLWRHYILGSKIEVLTDHRSIEYLNSQKNLSQKQARWLDTLEEFDLEIRYRKGSLNVVADSLSRSPPNGDIDKRTKLIMNKTIGNQFNNKKDKTEIKQTTNDLHESNIIDELTKQLEELKICALNIDNSKDETIKVELLHPKALLPNKTNENDTGYVVTTPNTVVINPNSITKVPLGIAVEAPTGTYIKVETHSELITKGILTLGGIVDRDYTGEIIAVLTNISKSPIKLEMGSCVAKLVPVYATNPIIAETENLEITQHESKGLGSPECENLCKVNIQTVSTCNSILNDNPEATYQGDRNLERIYRMVNGEKPHSQSAKNTLKKFHIKDKQLFKNGRKCIAKKEDRIKLLTEFHDSKAALHPGIQRTYEQLSQYYFWPDMFNMVKLYVQTCDKCQRIKHHNQPLERELQPLEIPTKPWQSVSLDFITHLPTTTQGNNSILVVVDRFSKMAHFIPTKDTVTGNETAKLYFNNIYRLHGLPESIISDRDPKFTANFWNCLWKCTGTQLRMSTAHHPQSDGQTERTNMTLESMLRAVISHNQKDWENYLCHAEFAFNSYKNASTKYSPFELNYGYVPRSPSITFNADNNNNPAAEEYLKEMKQRFQSAYENIEFAQQKMRENHDQGIKRSNIKVGDQVMISTKLTTPMHLQSRANKALQDKWHGPYKVLEIISNNAYRLKLPSTLRIHPVISCTFIKPYASTNDFHHRIKELPPPIIVDNQIEYEVESIKNHRMRYNQYEYLTHWKGYPDSEDTWQKESDLINAQELLNEYKTDNNLSERHLSKRGRV